jgi:hypothetical protein
VSWHWDERYLPEDIHSKLSEFHMALELLQEYAIADRDQGLLIGLGFGLLLRDCWAAVQLEDDAKDSPEILRKSRLDMQNVNQVLKAIEEVIGRLAQSGSAQQAPKELHGSPKRRKASAGQKKPVSRKGPTHTPPPVASTSKQSAMQTDGNIRSQRQRKPSMKLRGLE